MPMAPPLDPVASLEALGRAGITVSICCGPCGAALFGWSVHALYHGEEFERPFSALTFAHAVQIAEIESTKRCWIRQTTTSLDHARADFSSLIDQLIAAVRAEAPQEKKIESPELPWPKPIIINRG